MLHCFHQQYYTEYSDKTTTTTTTFTHSTTQRNKCMIFMYLCIPSAPLLDSAVCLWSSNVGLFRHRETRFSHVVHLTAHAVLWFGHSGWLLLGPLGGDWPGRGGWWDSGVLRSVRLAGRAGAAEAAAQWPPLLLALPAQPAADPQPDLLATLQQEVHQLHVRSGGTCTHKKKITCCFVLVFVWLLAQTYSES